MNSWLVDLGWAVALGLPLGYIWFNFGLMYFALATLAIVASGLFYYWFKYKR